MRLRLLGLASILAFTAACNQAPGTGEQGTAPPPPASGPEAPAATAPAENNAPAGAPVAPTNAPAGMVPSTGSGAARTGATVPGATPGAPAAVAAANPVGQEATPAPSMMEMTVAGGTPLEVTLETPVGSATSKVEDAVRGKVARAVVVGGMTVIPTGAPIRARCSKLRRRDA